MLTTLNNITNQGLKGNNRLSVRLALCLVLARFMLTSSIATATMGYASTPSIDISKDDSGSNSRGSTSSDHSTSSPPMIGGSGEKYLLKVVAKHADRYNLFFGTPNEMKTKISVLKEYCNS